MMIDKNMIVLPKAKPAPEDPRLHQLRRALARAIGETQLPAVLIEIDGLTRSRGSCLAGAALRA